MPMLTNNSRIAAKQIDSGLVQLGIALTLEAAYEDSQWGDDPFDGSREDYVAELQNESEEDDAMEGYEEWRDEEYGDNPYHDYLSHM